MSGQLECTQEKAPVGRGNFSTDTSQHFEDDTAEKAFATLQARFALLGHCLYRTDAANGPSVFLVSRGGMVKELPDMAAVCSFLALIGGKQ